MIETAEMIDHPSHYQGNSLECIDVIEAFGLGFNRGNSVKYTLRAYKKGDPIENLYKAIWYLNREIKNIERNRKREIRKIERDMQAKHATISGIAKMITDSIKNYEDEDFPIELKYQQGMEHPLFIITVTKEESDIFVDSYGNKWKRIPEDEED